MKKMDYQNVRGTQDFEPGKEVTRLSVKRVLEEVFEEYGCKPLETPILNYTNLLASKYAGGAEIKKEMYTLSDRGKRDLALRYDLTIPFAKFLAMNPSIRLPFKRYEIGKVFRDGPIKAGRFREFTQCDVDIAGVESQLAEAELLDMAVEALKRLEIPVRIQVNNRKLLSGMLKHYGVQREQENGAILILDKLEKIGAEAVLAELDRMGILENSLQGIRHFLAGKKEMALFEGIEPKNRELTDGIKEMKELISCLEYLGISEVCEFNPFLARGLEIYTGTVYEIFLIDGAIQSSIGSGGRYDHAIGGLIEGDKIATAGISFGLDVIFEAIRSEGERQKSTIEYYIIPVQAGKEALFLASQLRYQGLFVEVELGGRKIKKALEKANKENVPYAIIVGEKEIADGVYQLKDLKAGSTKTVPFIYPGTVR